MILVSKPLLGDEEKANLAECIDSTWISSEGPFVQELERKMAKYCNRKYGIAVNSGTTAIEVALNALELGSGEIIIPSLTIISCASASLRSGLTPVFIDVSLDDYNMIPEEIEKAVTNETKAIMIVHLLGQMVDVDAILKIAKKYKLKVIEDFSQAIGSFYKNSPAGSFGDISITSLFANKTITAGEGGLVLTNNVEHDKESRKYRSNYFGDINKFQHDKLGYNFKMSNMEAAVGVAQFNKIYVILKNKFKISTIYNNVFKDLKNIKTPVIKDNCVDSCWMYSLVLNNKETRDGLMNHLSSKKIQSRTFFTGLHQQKPLKKISRTLICKNTEYLSDCGIYLPTGAGHSEDDINLVAKEVVSYLENKE